MLLVICSISFVPPSKYEKRVMYDRYFKLNRIRINKASCDKRKDRLRKGPSLVRRQKGVNVLFV